MPIPPKISRKHTNPPTWITSTTLTRTLISPKSTIAKQQPILAYDLTKSRRRSNAPAAQTEEWMIT